MSENVLGLQSLARRFGAFTAAVSVNAAEVIALLGQRRRQDHTIKMRAS
jgi:hypothetical protein